VGALPLDAFHIVLALLAFFLGGWVKGTVGIGLPTVSLAILSSGLGLRESVALMAVSALATNFVQAFQGGAFRELVHTHWSLALGSFAGVWLGTLVLYHVDPLLLTGVLGVILCLYSIWSLIAVPVRVPPASIPVLGPITGIATGAFTGATGSLVFPLLIYLQGLRLEKDRFVQLSGILATMITGALVLAAADRHMYDGTLAPAALLALVPSFAGLYLGQRVRRRLSEDRFRTWLFIALLVLSLNLLRKGFL
jgi:hypothetical protein